MKTQKLKSHGSYLKTFFNNVVGVPFVIDIREFKYGTYKRVAWLREEGPEYLCELNDNEKEICQEFWSSWFNKQ